MQLYVCLIVLILLSPWPSYHLSFNFILKKLHCIKMINTDVCSYLCTKRKECSTSIRRRYTVMCFLRSRLLYKTSHVYTHFHPERLLYTSWNLCVHTSISIYWYVYLRVCMCVIFYLCVCARMSVHWCIKHGDLKSIQYTITPSIPLRLTDFYETRACALCRLFFQKLATGQITSSLLFPKASVFLFCFFLEKKSTDWRCIIQFMVKRTPWRGQLRCGTVEFWGKNIDKKQISTHTEDG